VLIFAAILATFIYGMIAAMLGTILPELSDRFQLAPRQNGTIAPAQALGLIVASLAVGHGNLGTSVPWFPPRFPQPRGPLQALLTNSCQPAELRVLRNPRL
jgi:hypothetical protein